MISLFLQLFPLECKPQLYILDTFEWGLASSLEILISGFFQIFLHIDLDRRNWLGNGYINQEDVANTTSPAMHEKICDIFS